MSRPNLKSGFAPILTLAILAILTSALITGVIVVQQKVFFRGRACEGSECSWQGGGWWQPESTTSEEQGPANVDQANQRAGYTPPQEPYAGEYVPEGGSAGNPDNTFVPGNDSGTGGTATQNSCQTCLSKNSPAECASLCNITYATPEPPAPRCTCPNGADCPDGLYSHCPSKIPEAAVPPLVSPANPCRPDECQNCEEDGGTCQGFSPNCACVVTPTSIADSSPGLYSVPEPVPPATNIYLPQLNKKVNITDNKIYDAENGQLMGSLKDYADYFYLAQSMGDNLSASAYGLVTAETFRSPAWKNLRDVADAALLDALPDYKIQAINSTLHYNITYDPIVDVYQNKIQEAEYEYYYSPSDKTGSAQTDIKGDFLTYYDKYHTPTSLLEDKLAQNKSVCIDIAIAEQAYFASRGIPSQLVVTSNHAFLSVDMAGRKYAVDPTWNIVEPLNLYQSTFAFGQTIDPLGNYFGVLGNIEFR